MGGFHCRIKNAHHFAQKMIMILQHLINPRHTCARRVTVVVLCPFSSHAMFLYTSPYVKVCKASKRASETYEQTLLRQKQNRTCMASMRASETFEQTLHRQQQDGVHKATIRATETPSESSITDYDKHKHLLSSLCRGFYTSVLFIFSVATLSSTYILLCFSLCICVLYVAVVT